MIWQEIEARAAAISARPAIVCGNVRLSYGDLVAAVRSRAAELPLPHGTGPARVLLMQAEPLDLLLSLLACWSRGLVPVILREGRSGQSVADLCHFLDPVARIDGSEVALLSPPGAGQEPRSFCPRDEALVICTSGTTAAPKLVALPAEAMTRNAAEIATRLGFGPDDRIAVPTPLTYMYGLMGGAMSGLHAGACLYLFGPTAPPTELQAAIRNEALTVLQGPPSLLRLFLAYWNGAPFDGVRLVTTGGERMGQDLPRQLAEAFPEARLEYLYGMTEAGPRISHRQIDPARFVEGELGLPFAHFDWHIAPVDAPDLPSGAGRLLIRGPTVFLGYLCADGSYEGLDAEGYFPSTDLVRIDGQGRFYYVERLDRLFKSGGKLVNPAEIETVLLDHPAVAEARCRAASHPLLGFVPVAEVVLKHGHSCPVAALQDHCRTALQSHAIPRQITIHDHFPLMPSGKRASGGS